MIRTLAATGAVALAGSVSLDPPLSRWLLAAALGAAITVAVVLLWKAEASYRAWSDQRRDARRRASFR